MALDTGLTNEKVKVIRQAVDDFGVLLGQRNENFTVEGLEVVPGLDMEVEASAYTSMSEALGEGIFKLMIMGPFKNGKSTTINAMVGEYVNATKATACTAIINVTKGGNDIDHVKVYHTDSVEPEVITKEQFLEEYNITDEEIESIEQFGVGLDRYKNVEYAETECNHELFRNGVQIIDSPGLEENVSRTKATLSFVPKANAIIFELNAIKLFSANEREYIEEHFADKQRKNVFFLVNRMNQLMDEDSVVEIKKSVRKGLHDVFLDANGVFDEELYRKRVFFINAYGAYCAKIGKPQKMIVNDELYVVKEKDTGMPEFEEALTEFLTSEERLIATFQSTLTNMANSYLAAEKMHENTVQTMSQSLDEMMANAARSQEKLDALDKNIQDIESAIEKTSKHIQTKVYNDLVNFVSVKMPQAWAKESQKIKVPFNILSYAELFMANMPFSPQNKRSQKQMKILKPLTDAVQKFISRQLDNWAKSVPALIAIDIADLEEELGESIHDFDMGLAQAASMFQIGVGTYNRDVGAVGRLQQAVALFNWDISLATEIENGGKMDTSTFIKRIVTQLALDFAVTLVMGAPFLIPALVIEAISMIFRAGQMGNKLMEQMAGKMFPGLEKEITRKEYQLTGKIKESFDEQKNKITSAARGLVAEEKAKQARMLEMKAGKEAEFDAEKNRQQEILNAMFARFSSVYDELYSEQPTHDTIEKMASESKGNGNV